MISLNAYKKYVNYLFKILILSYLDCSMELFCKMMKSCIITQMFVYILYSCVPDTVTKMQLLNVENYVVIDLHVMKISDVTIVSTKLLCKIAEDV